MTPIEQDPLDALATAALTYALGVSGFDVEGVRALCRILRSDNIADASDLARQWDRDLSRLHSEVAELQRTVASRDRQVLDAKREVARLESENAQLRHELDAANLVATEALEALPAQGQRVIISNPTPDTPAVSAMPRPALVRPPEQPRAEGEFQTLVTAARREVSVQLRTANLPTVNVTTAAEKEYSHLANDEKDRALEVVKRWMAGDARARLMREKAPNQYHLRNARVLVHVSKGLAGATYTITSLTLVR